MNKLLSDLKLSLWISLRFLITPEENKQLNKVTWICILVISISIIVIILFISVLNGYQEGLLKQSIDKDFHLTLSKKHFHESKEVVEKLQKLPDVKNVIPYFSVNGILEYDEKFIGINLRAYNDDFLSENDFQNINFKLLKGRLPVDEPLCICIGIDLLNNLNVKFEDFNKEKTLWVTLIFSNTSLDGDNSKKLFYRHLKVVGVFDTGYSEINSSIVLCSLSSTKQLFGEDNYISGIGIYLYDRDKAENIRSFIRSEFHGLRHYISYWINNKEGLLLLFGWQKKILWVLLSIILIIIFFIVYIQHNVMFQNKKNDISILKSLGIDLFTLNAIMLFTSLVISIIGVIIGNIVGFILISNIKRIFDFVNSITSIKLFSINKISYVNYLYSINLSEIILMTCGIIFVVLISSFISSFKLKYEKPMSSILQKYS